MAETAQSEPVTTPLKEDVPISKEKQSPDADISLPSSVGSSEKPPSSNTVSPQEPPTLSATSGKNYMVAKTATKRFDAITALADRAGMSMATSLELSLTPARRPYRGAIPVKSRNTWRADGEGEADTARDSPDGLENEDPQKSFGRGKAGSDDDDNDEVIGARAKHQGRGKRRENRRMATSETDDDDESMPEAVPQSLPPGGLEDMVEYLAITAREHGFESDSDDDDNDEDDKVALQKDLGGADGGDIVLSQTTHVPVAHPIPVGDEYYMVQGDSDDSDVGRRRNTSYFSADRKRGKKVKKKQAKDDGSDDDSDDSDDSDDDTEAKGGGGGEKKRRRRRSKAETKDDSDSDNSAESKD
mmetsp:Transcript_3421/g.7237  ORF Transcript_3421/g.7237 Transcript_3421/m.7237 type:complete len:358 (+) Transcript_3421:173-1246(+)